MGATLSVFKIVNPNKDKLKNGLNSRPQQTFSDLDLTDELEEARSTLNFFEYDEKKDRIKYKAVHYSDTIQHPIRIYLDEIEDSFSGISEEDIQKIRKGTKRIEEFQEIHKFEVIIDFKTEEVYVFVNKKIANSFMRRFKKAGFIDYEKLYFDMNKIDDIPDLLNIWGCWENCNSARCKKKAYFGTEVNKVEGLDKKSVTSYNVEYELDSDTIVDLFITKECRLSSHSNIMHNSELFNTYNAIKEILGVSTKNQNPTGALPEEE